MSPKLEAIGWAIAEGHTGDYPFQLRFRQFESDFPYSNFSQRLNIFWSMQNPDKRGYASESELEHLHSFEDRLVAAVETDHFSVLAMTVTGSNEREFVFYTSDPTEFIKRLSLMPQEEVRYPIEIHRSDDDKWEYYNNEIRNVRPT